MKILYVTTVGSTMSFFKSLIKGLISEGNIVDIATNEQNSPVSECYREWGCKVYPISCTRSPINKGSVSAIKELKKIVQNGKYDVVHCHTPIAAMCTRMACRKLRKQGVKVVYTAHGFHFFKGAPLKNWMIYYAIEKLCSRYTDILITINKEDFALARKKMKASSVLYVPGVGIDITKFADVVVDRTEYRNKIGIPEEAFLVLSVGELNANKNHEVVIRALAQLNNANVHYALVGKGGLKDKLASVANEMGVSQNVHFLGFRSDVACVYKVADCFIHPSKREGLPVAIMEAMSSGVPVICSNIRGNTDLIEDKVNGIVVDSTPEAVASAILDIISDVQSRDKYIENSKEKIKEFDMCAVCKTMKEIYKNV